MVRPARDILGVVVVPATFRNDINDIEGVIAKNATG